PCFMRVLLLLTLSLAVSSLSAQSHKKLDKLFGGWAPSKWEVSLTFSHRTNQQVSIFGRTEVNPRDIPISMQSILDTISIAGTERVFRTSVPGEINIDASDPNFWFGAQFRAHRSLGRNFQLAVGLHYDQLSYSTRDADGNVPALGVVNTSGPYLYPVAEVQESSIGLVLHMDYHLFPKHKFHPFFGFGLSGLVNSWERTLTGQIYSPEPDQLIPATAPQTTASTTFNLDFISTGGLLYRLHPRWQVALTFSSRIGNGSGRLGGQVRYRL
ncbi:MAG: hypothetical protein AAF597_03320, partial [Bacteroidota bacterium]